MKQDFLADELMHYGTPGMHWYERLYQNKDGSLTPLGKLRYGKGGKAKTNVTKDKRDPKVLKELQEMDRKQNAIDDVKNAEYDSEMTKLGWNTTPMMFNEKPYRMCTRKGKLGEKPVQLVADWDAKRNDDDVDPKEAAKNLNDDSKKFEKEYKKVLSTVKEDISKELYDTWLFEEWHSGTKYENISRDEFKDLLNISLIDLKGNGYANICLNDGNYATPLFGYHTIEIEYDINDDKTYHGASLQG